MKTKSIVRDSHNPYRGARYEITATKNGQEVTGYFTISESKAVLTFGDYRLLKADLVFGTVETDTAGAYNWGASKSPYDAITAHDLKAVALETVQHHFGNMFDR